MSNQTENDKKVLELKNKIKEKKALLNKGKKFSPTTNASLILPQFDKVYNLHTLDIDTCRLLLVHLNTYKMSAKDLNLDGPLVISNYNVDLWIEDLRSRMENLSIKSEEQKLHNLEKKLEQLLSEDKRTQLELDSIEDLLK